MRLLVYSDVHGNLPAMETMLQNAGRIDGCICLGDLVNYGPWSNECVDLAISIPNSVFIKGNHEQAFINGRYQGKNLLVNKFFNQCYPGFQRFEEIKTFAENYILNDIIFTHTIQNRNIYIDTEIALDKNYVIGHSHHQFLKKINGCFLWNTGSVGQNRKYMNIINYLIYNTENQIFEPIAIRYDVDVLIREMKNRNYPAVCIEYYEKKEKILI